MVSVTQVASYIADRYWKDFGMRIDEMKLHKLLYLVQRECLVQRREPMFSVSDIQRRWLDGLRCVRLSSDVAHLRENFLKECGLWCVDGSPIFEV